MEKALFLSQEALDRPLPEGYDRVYFGSEFCERRIPSLPALEALVRRTHDADMRFTLVTPYVTDEGLDRVEELCRALSGQAGACEVVVNDWGVLRLLHERFPSLEPVLGRLLVKQKRCPTLARVLKRAPAAMMRHADPEHSDRVLVMQVKLPPAMDEYYRGSNAGSVPVLQKCLSGMGVRRIELDNPLHGVKVSLGQGVRAASLYVPFVYVSTTFYCPSAGCDGPQSTMRKRRPCSQQCARYVFSLEHASFPLPLLLRGNTHFYRNDSVDESRIARMGVDRLVYASAPPV
jgi:hypothetical protein